MNQLTTKQKSLIIGSIMGDGWITKGTKGNPVLCIQHSIKQLDYLLWKKQRFEEEGFIVNGIYDVTKKGSPYPAYRIDIVLGEIGKILRHQLYPNDNKTITRHHLNMLDKEGLAIWYMDDGSCCLHKKKDGTIKSREIHIATHKFTYDEHAIMQRYLEVVWKVKMNIYRDRGKCRFACGATEGKKLIALIKQHIHPKMTYKIDLQYKKV